MEGTCGLVFLYYIYPKSFEGPRENLGFGSPKMYSIKKIYRII